jgi:DNA primase
MQTVEIVDVISDYVSLKRRGTNYIGNCPFHNERTPSFNVSPAKGIFKCFGCGKAGNTVHFIMEHEHLSYPDALRTLAKKYGIAIQEKELTPEQIKDNTERESLLLVTEYAKKFFVDQLFKTEEGQAVGLSYFKERGFSIDTINKFELGYSAERGNLLTQAAEKAGYQLAYLEKTGLVSVKENYTGDKMRGRVIFPIHGLTGRTIAFGARILRTDVNMPKYLNSPESVIYHKSDVLYGIFQAKSQIVKSDKCFLVEGYTDVISLHQAGITNVVASSGTSLTENQIRLIKRFTNQLTILYDGDWAGIKASLRGIDMVLSQDMDVRIVLFPDGDDPDSFSRKHTAEEVLEFIAQNEKDFIKFKAQLLLTDKDLDAVSKANAINDIIRTIAKIEDPIKRQVYIKETHQLVGFDERQLSFQVGNFLSVEKQKAESKQINNSQNIRGPLSSPIQEPEVEHSLGVLNEIDPIELELLKTLIYHANETIVFDNEEQTTVGAFIISELDHDQITLRHQFSRNILSLFLTTNTDGSFLSTKQLVDHSDPFVSIQVTQIESEAHNLSKYWEQKNLYQPPKSAHYKKTIIKTLLEYKTRWILRQMAEILEQIQQAKPEQLAELMQNYQQYNTIKMMLAKELGERVIVN